tara:strand:+ start:401 stop:559 length:159 start_codon:yes stop_codon:yes gene_type:complete
MDFQTIPIVRIFDEQKARDFYLDFLGMTRGSVAVSLAHLLQPVKPLIKEREA